MHWPIVLNRSCKCVRDIENVSIYDQKWFDGMINEGYYYPTSGTYYNDGLKIPQGWWWRWGSIRG